MFQGHAERIGKIRKQSNTSQHSTDDSNRYNVEADISRWLSEEGWQLSPYTQTDLCFGVAADDGSTKLIVAQLAQMPDRISIEAGITIIDDHVNKFAGLPEKKRREFLWDLRFALLQMDVAFQGLSEPLQQVMVGQTLYCDALTKDLFMQRLSEVEKAVLLVIWKVGRLMEEPPPQAGFFKG